MAPEEITLADLVSVNVLSTAQWDDYMSDDPKLEYGGITYWSYLTTADFQHKPIPADAANLFLISGTGWGDYVGSSVDRANYEALLEEYGEDTFVRVYDSIGSQTLALLPTWPFKCEAECTQHADAAECNTDAAERWQALLGQLWALSDYPLISDEVHSRIESDAAWEAWGQYLGYDVVRELAELGYEDVSEDSIKGKFYTLTSEGSSYAYLETAVDVVFPELRDTVTELAAWLDSIGKVGVSE